MKKMKEAVKAWFENTDEDWVFKSVSISMSIMLAFIIFSVLLSIVSSFQ